MIKVENSKLCLVVSDFNSIITDSMKKAAIHCFLEKGGDNKNIKIYKVSGAFEIPNIISKNIKKFDAFIALGCVIKGQTPHFDFISQASTNAIMDLSIQSKKPIGNGIITCLNKKQALARKKKGAEAANAVISVLLQK